MRMHRRWNPSPGLALLVIAAFAALFGAASAEPPSRLDELRTAGMVGERFDGKAVLRTDDAPADVKALIESVNDKRGAIYEMRAKEQGVPADQVGRVYAGEIWDKAPPGTWFLDAEGVWAQK